MIGLPTKDGIEKPLFDYEREIYFALLRPGYLNSYPSTNQFNIKTYNILFLFKEKQMWIKKAAGLGVTEFMLRFMARLLPGADLTYFRRLSQSLLVTYEFSIEHFISKITDRLTNIAYLEMYFRIVREQLTRTRVDHLSNSGQFQKHQLLTS
jgi:hypothetical protein